MASPVYELAGKQEALPEEVLAVLYSDQPVREDVRPGDSRRHWQWFARDPVGQTSRGWLGFAQPITTGLLTLTESRYESAIAAAFVPDFATSVEVTATQITLNEIEISWVIEIPRGTAISGSTVLSGGA